MRIPISWLREYVDVGEVSAEEIAEILTLGGLEVDAVERPAADVRGVVVAEVRDVAKVEVTLDRKRSLTLLFDPEHALDERIAMEQFAT